MSTNIDNITNTHFGGERKAKNTWLSGKVKCGRCGAGLMCMSAANKVSYFRCRKRADRKSCDGCGTLQVLDMEPFIFDEMMQKMHEFQTLTGGNSL